MTLKLSPLLAAVPFARLYVQLMGARFERRSDAVQRHGVDMLLQQGLLSRRPLIVPVGACRYDDGGRLRSYWEPAPLAAPWIRLCPVA